MNWSRPAHRRFPHDHNSLSRLHCTLQLKPRALEDVDATTALPIRRGDWKPQYIVGSLGAASTGGEMQETSNPSCESAQA